MNDRPPHETGPLVALAGRVWRSRLSSDGEKQEADTPENGPEHTAATTTLRVVVVEDEPDLRVLIRRILERDGGFEVVGEAGDGATGTEVTQEHQPDIVLLDLLMPGRTGREALPDIVRLAPRTMTVVLSALQATVEAEPAISRGAFAYIEKSELTPDLPATLRDLYATFAVALSGETVLAPSARDD